MNVFLNKQPKSWEAIESQKKGEKKNRNPLSVSKKSSTIRRKNEILSST